MSGPTIGNERVRTHYSFECSLAFFLCLALITGICFVFCGHFSFIKKKHFLIFFSSFLGVGAFRLSVFDWRAIGLTWPTTWPTRKKKKVQTLLGDRSIDRHGRTKEKLWRLATRRKQRREIWTALFFFFFWMCVEREKENGRWSSGDLVARQERHIIHTPPDT